ncbi:hypothetical protein TNCV_4366581 [Trichonephila clavipes]|nr:hypothetical protein TNCV_4366581 [Trichonephila clavipes]
MTSSSHDSTGLAIETLPPPHAFTRLDSGVDVISRDGVGIGSEQFQGCAERTNGEACLVSYLGRFPRKLPAKSITAATACKRLRQLVASLSASYLITQRRPLPVTFCTGLRTTSGHMDDTSLTTPHRREDVSSSRILAHRCPASITGLELVTKPATIRCILSRLSGAISFQVTVCSIVFKFDEMSGGRGSLVVKTSDRGRRVMRVRPQCD